MIYTYHSWEEPIIVTATRLQSPKGADSDPPPGVDSRDLRPPGKVQFTGNASVGHHGTSSQKLWYSSNCGHWRACNLLQMPLDVQTTVSQLDHTLFLHYYVN